MRNPRFTFPVFSLVLATAVWATTGCGSKPNDAQIAAQVKSQLAADSALQGQAIAVAANHGIVTLSGTVSGQGSRELAGNDAARVKGVSTVLNNLVVGSAAMGGDQGNGPGNDPGNGQNTSPPGQNSGNAQNSANAMMNGKPIQSYSDSAPPPPPPAQSAPAPAQRQSLVIPAGTRIRVQLAQTLSTKQS